MTVLGLRPATPADDEFCFELHKAAMGAYVTAIWGWDEQVQRGYHSRAFDPGHWQIVTADGADVGMLAVDHHPTEIYVGRIELLPAHQGRGIGTELITTLLDQAGRQGKALVLDVLTVNHRARALYQRLGLREVARHGDGQIKIRMCSTPPPPAAGQ
ncbi:N-acetyltransferase family protein [Spirillospora sp. CA-142024]|uniref:GNAT family N-acetyltransferase n=1 Tax=Spirillospora sp. CA-142024 TaxID=3240036 RepID=UPI003D8A7F68